MKNTNQHKNEQLTIAIGFVLILFVFVFTLLRGDIFNKNEEATDKGGNRTAESSTTPKYKTISTSELQKKIANEKDKITLLDIRPFDSYIEEHIVDSLNIALNEFPVSGKIDAHSQIIVIGQQADQDVATAVAKLKDEDYKNILVLAGGIEGWKQLLGPTVTYGNPKSFVDQTKVSYLDPEELNEAIKAQAPLYIIDIRSAQEYAKGHIAGAINIPFDDLEKRRGDVKERKAVVVGSNELQEFQASVQLFDMLLVSPYVMRQAMPGWESKGFPMTAS